MKDNTNIKGEVKKFIISHYLFRANDTSIGDNDSFLEKGIIDSIGVIELTNFIQARYDIKIKVPEIIPENLDTLNNIEAYVLKKIKSKNR